MSDKKITCSCCGSRNCFEEEYKDPDPAILEMVQTWLCMNCGYSSSSLYKKQTDGLQEMLNTSPKLVIDLKKWDKDKEIYWFPSIITIMSKGMLFPDGSKDFWEWKYIPVIKIPKEERKKYRIPGTKGNSKKCFLKQRFAMELTQTFEQDNFQDALRAMGAIIDI